MARIARLVSGVALGMFVATAARPCRADDTARAEQEFQAGNEAFAAGDYHVAFERYRAAWSLKQTFDIACNLGRTEVELSLSRDAAEHLDYCLRTFSVSSRDDVRDANKRFRDLFEKVRREVGALNVDARPDGAEIIVDGASYGIAPLDHTIYLTPGTHAVRARLAGFQEQRRSITAIAGGSLDVTLRLVAKTPARPEPAASSKAEPSARARPEAVIEDHGPEPRTIVLISGAATSLVALGVGVGFAIDADAASRDASRLGAELHAGGVSECSVGSTAPSCAALQHAIDRQTNSRDRADLALGAGALLGGLTVAAWLLIPDLARPGSTGLRALPWIGRRSTGLAVAGSY